VTKQFIEEKRRAKIIFWCLMPFFFAGFVRFYLAVFNLLYGLALTALFGASSLGVVVTVSLITSVVLSVATCFFLWNQYKKHILEG
jgi:hypothetical protein